MTKLCECGCGQPAPIATKTNNARGIVKNQPVRFIHNHHFKGVRGPDHPQWKGGINHHGDGYVFEMRPNHPAANRHGYVAQHRLAVEQKLRRYLTTNEIVHHINHDPSDNRPENLQVMTRVEHGHLHNPAVGCRVSPCKRKHKAHGLCDSHYKYALRNNLPFDGSLPFIPRRKHLR